MQMNWLHLYEWKLQGSSWPKSLHSWLCLCEAVSLVVKHTAPLNRNFKKIIEEINKLQMMVT